MRSFKPALARTTTCSSPPSACCAAEFCFSRAGAWIRFSTGSSCWREPPCSSPTKASDFGVWPRNRQGARPISMTSRPPPGVGRWSARWLGRGLRALRRAGAPAPPLQRPRRQFRRPTPDEYYQLRRPSRAAIPEQAASRRPAKPIRAAIAGVQRTTNGPDAWPASGERTVRSAVLISATDAASARINAAAADRSDARPTAPNPTAAPGDTAAIEQPRIGPVLIGQPLIGQPQYPTVTPGR